MANAKAILHSDTSQDSTATDTPSTIQGIIQTLQPYIVRYASPRPTFHKTLASGQEIETKIHTTSPQEVVTVMESLRPLGLCGAEHRSEWHEISDLPDGAHISRVHIAGTGEIWLKTKSKNIPFYTTRYRYPMVHRSSEKLKPGEPGYADTYQSISSLPITTSFNKECINFFYPYGGAIFSLSFSLAWNAHGFVRQEMEFEYEGLAETKAQQPSSNDTEHLFETMLTTLLPAPLLARLHAQTKYESLTTATGRPIQ